MNTLNRYGVLAFAAIALAGCSGTPEDTQKGAQVEDRTVQSNVPSTSNVGSGAVAGNTSGSTLNPVPIAPGVSVGAAAGGRGDPALRDPRSPLSQRSIYFDYDGFVVSPEYRVMIEAHAKYLIANRGARMRIEGNTDERGSREYNLALGQRRADGVKRALAILGANETQIETVSFGEEKPRNTSTSEETWRENRRADIAYAGE